MLQLFWEPILRSNFHIDQIRSASREIVRYLGFMGGPFAGTQLSPSAVHALIELEKADGLTARELGEVLGLEKSSVSRMLRKLVSSGDVIESAEAGDRRTKMLVLSPTGKRRVTEIHSFARAQVVSALDGLTYTEQEEVHTGLRRYAEALSATPKRREAPHKVEIVTEYLPGALARIIEMHAVYYSREVGFGRRFETAVAGGLSEFYARLENPRNALFIALFEQQVVGSIAIDGEDIGSDRAHLRWFIVDDFVRGSGVGQRLLSAALEFVDRNQFRETHLWTFEGLEAARKLYERNGFILREARPGDQWGEQVMEQRLVRPAA